MEFLIELWAFMRTRKKFWLLPIFVVMALFGGLVVLSQGSAVAPFIYTIFEPVGWRAHLRRFRLLSRQRRRADR